MSNIPELSEHHKLSWNGGIKMLAGRESEKIRRSIKTIFIPRKIRELKAQVTHEGFVCLPKRGKGSHERWRHPLLRKTLTIPGKDGDDVPLYLEKQLEKLLTELKNLEEDS
jgi:predicted RNA binding protein YcfA (HicA-like mRNA interferase family)